MFQITITFAFILHYFSKQNIDTNVGKAGGLSNWCWSWLLCPKNVSTSVNKENCTKNARFLVQSQKSPLHTQGAWC
ncbi:MAG: hypothetical protein EAZ95_09745 [Bacteroidetes bacterium]|nr:MAG: hypothetical protein EAZ95_09745 [Bacteroidota bacterium]